jgi:hypothetical protein
VKDSWPIGLSDTLSHVDPAPLARPNGNSAGRGDAPHRQHVHIVNLGRGVDITAIDDIARTELATLVGSLVQVAAVPVDDPLVADACAAVLVEPFGDHDVGKSGETWGRDDSFSAL